MGQKEYDEFLEELAQPAGLGDAGEGSPAGISGTPRATSAYEEELDQIERESRGESALKRSMFIVSEKNADPDEAARRLRISQRTGIPADWIPEFKDEATRRSLLSSPAIQDLPRTSPKTTRWLADPVNAGVAHDDIEPLAGIEGIVDMMGRGAPAIGTPDVVGAFRSGQRQQWQGRIGWRLKEGETTPGLREEATALGGEISAQNRVMQDKRGTLSGDFLEPAAQVLGQMFEGGKYAVGKGLKTGMIMGGVGTAMGPAAPVTAPAAALAGLGAGTTAGFFEDSMRVEGGLAYLELTGIRGAKGEALPEESVRTASTIVGIVNGALELAGLKVLAAPWKRLVRKGVQEAALVEARQLLTRQTTGRAVGTFAKEYAAGVSAETVQEIAQEVTNVLAEETLKSQAPGGTFDPTTAEEIGRRLYDIASQTARAMAVIGIVGPGANLRSDIRAARAGRTAQETFRALGDVAKISKLRGRLPEKFREFVDHVTADGPAANVFIPVEEWNTYWQSQNADPAAVAAEVLGDRAQYQEALAAGSDLVIPTGRYAEVLAGTEHHAGLSMDMRLHPGEMTAREAGSFRQNFPGRVAELDALLEGPEGTGQGSDQKVYDDVLAQLTKAGRAPEVAAREALLWQVRYRTRAARLGVDPFELYQERQLKITAPGIEGATAEGVPEGTTLSQAAIPPKGYPAEHEGWSYDGTYEGTGVHQYTDRNPDSPTYKDTIAVKAPEQLAGKIEGIRKARELGQEGGKDKRGFIRFGPGGETEIGLLEKANLSTFLHETGHDFLEELRQDAARENAPEQLRGDWKAIAEHFGIADLAPGAALPTQSHEGFARSFEAYLMEGKSPSPELASAFARFKAWLVQVYREISRLNVKLNDDVRGVFDRLVATDEEISAAEKQQRRTPIFATAEAAGMTQAEFSVYRRDVQAAHEVARERLERQLIAEFARERTALWKEEREIVRVGVEEEANQNNLFQAFHALTKGKTVGGETVGPPIKLSRTGLVAEFGEEWVKKLPAWTRQLYSAKGGMSPALVAEMFGFPSGRDLVQGLLEGPRREAWIEAETDRRMKETHGDLLHDGSIAEAALAALHNDETGAVLREELRALRRKRLQVRPHVDQALRASETQQRDLRREMEASIPPIAAFRQLARETVSRKSILQLQPHLYLRAEEKAGRKAFEAAARGDFDTAAVEKNKQLLNHYLFLEASKAREEADRALRYMQGLTRPAAQERIGLAGGGFLEQINALLDRYEFVKISEAQLERRKETLQAWAQRWREEGFEPAIDPSLFMEGERVNYRTLSIEDLGAVRDAALSIEHIARESRKVLEEGKAIEFGEGLARLQERLQDENKARKPLPLTEADMTWWEKRSAQARRLIGMFVRPETLIEWMDGGKSGPWHDLLWNLSVDAGNKRNQLRERVLVPLKGILDRIPKDRAGRMFEKVAIAGLNGAELSHYTLIGIALNTGNESNLDKLRRGGLWIGENFHPLPDHILDEIRSKLDKADWDLIQGLWDTANTLWPDLAEHSRAVSGVPVEKIEATAFQTPFGEYQGGYWPMVYDRTHSEIGRKQTAANTPMDEIYGKNNTRAHTPKSHRTGRTGAAAPILFDWKRVATKHMNDVITDLSHWRFVNQVRRILADGTLRHAIINRMGEPAYASLEGWLRFTVSGRFDGDPAADPLHRVMDGAITNVAIGALGFKVTTAFGNAVVAPIQAWGQVKAIWIARGMAEYVGNVSGTTEAVHELSPAMKYRQLQLDQSYQEVVTRLAGKRSIRREVALVAMSVHAYSDRITSTAIWMGAYRQAEDEGKSPQEAVRFADSVISTSQLAGAPKDLSAFERDPRYRAWRLFLGPMIILQNRLRSVFRKHGVKALVRPEAIGKLLAYWVIPSVVYELAVGRGPGDDEDPAEWLLLKILLYPAQMFPFLREASAFVEAKVRHKYGGYRMDTVSEAVKSIVEFGYATADYVAGDEDLEKVVKTGLRASGPALGVPATQMSITGEHAYDLMTGEYVPETPWDGFKYLFVRRPKGK